MKFNFGVFKFFFLILFQVMSQSQDASVTPTPTTSVGTTEEPKVFSPIVTATCRAGLMTIKVETLNDFVGVVQSRDHRKPECSGYGENTKVTFLRVNMVAQPEDSDYCGVFLHEVNFVKKCLSHSFSLLMLYFRLLMNTALQ